MTDTANKNQRLINIVRQWADIYQAVCQRAQHADITAEDFAAIEELITPDFRRIGIYKDEADWAECLEKYIQFTQTSLWSGTLRYMHVVDNTVFQELEETITRGGGKNVIYTMSVYEFDDNEKVQALRVYMQQEQQTENVLVLGTDGK